jgi:hypothetical protein
VKRYAACGAYRIDDILPLTYLEHGRLYLADGRTGHVGVWDDVDKAIVFARRKFPDYDKPFLQSEPHWDADENHGTAQPYQALEERAPEGWDERCTRGYLQDEKVLPWLLEMEKKYPDDSV